MSEKETRVKEFRVVVRRYKEFEVRIFAEDERLARLNAGFCDPDFEDDCHEGTEIVLIEENPS